MEAGYVCWPCLGGSQTYGSAYLWPCWIHVGSSLGSGLLAVENVMAVEQILTGDVGRKGHVLAHGFYGNSPGF